MRTLNSRPIAGIIGLCIALSVSACGALPTRTIDNDHEVAMKADRRQVAASSTTSFSAANATPEQRRATLENIWKTIRASYYDETFGGVDIAAVEAEALRALPAVRSDAEYYEVLGRSVAALHDSHTGVFDPEDAAIVHAQQAPLFGIGWQVVDEHVVITTVRAGSAAAEAGLKAGMLLDAVDGHALDHAFFDEAADTPRAFESSGRALTDDERRRGRQTVAVGELLAGADASTHTYALTLRRSDDTVFEAHVQRRVLDLPSTVDLEILPPKIALLAFNRFDPSLEKRLIAAIETARLQSDGLIIDLRDNGGGSDDLLLPLMDRLLDHKTLVAQIRHRFWFGYWNDTFTSHPVAHPYPGRIAVLIDGSSASMAEVFADALVALRGAIAVGQPTCGCVVANRDDFALPDGGMLRVSQAGVLGASGRRLEGHPLQPAILVTPTLRQLRQREDVALDTAVATLRSMSRE